MIGVRKMQEITLKRKIYTELQKWKKEYAPEYALFIKGARRVGKTTIAEELGKMNTNHISQLIFNPLMTQ